MAQLGLLQSAGIGGRAAASGCSTAQPLQLSATMVGLAWAAIPGAIAGVAALTRATSAAISVDVFMGFPSLSMPEA